MPEETPYPDEIKGGLGWTPYLSSKNADVSEELRFARKLYPLPEETALEYRTAHGLSQPAPSWNGGEHNAFLAEDDPSRVVKMSKWGSGFGFGLNEDKHGEGLVFRRTSLRTYIQRITLTNEIFGDDMKALGVVFDKENWQSKLVTSQPYRGEQESTYEEIIKRMESLGFRLVDNRALRQSLANGTYYNEEKNILVSDCHPRNFRTVNGVPWPIDIVMERPEGRFLEFVKQNLSGGEQTQT